MGLDFCENMDFSVCVAHYSETISTTDLELQGYIFMPPHHLIGVHRFACVRRASVRPSLKSLCESGMWGHLCPMDIFLSFMYSDMSFL